MFRQVIRRIIWWTIEIFVAGAFLLALYVGGRTLYNVSVQVKINTLTLAREQKERQLKDEMIKATIDDIYKTLYTEPDNPASHRQPSVVELWQRNRDKELRDRIQKLERWRFEMER